MELSKDQVRVVKSTVIYVCASIVICPLGYYLIGKPMSWGDFFIFAGMMIAIGLIVGGFLTLGSIIHKKEDK